METRAIAGFNTTPRSKESCHCLIRTGLGAMSQVGMEMKDILRILPVSSVRAILEGRQPLPLLRDAAYQSRMLKR